MDLKSFALSLVEEVDAEPSDELVEQMRHSFAMLQALVLVHWANHWEASGVAQYGDHQLYERIYDAAKESTDKFAERVIGIFGVNVFRLGGDVAELIAEEISEHAEHGSLVDRAIHAEERAIESLTETWESLKSEGIEAPGLVEDLMPALISAREESLYLLRQRNV